MKILPTTPQSYGQSEPERRRMRRRFARIARGAYAERTGDFRGALRAVRDTLPASALFSHHTAARLWGAVVPHHEQIRVTIPHKLQVAKPEILAFRTRSLPAARILGGLSVTSPERTLVDLSTELSLVDLVVAADSLQRRRRLDLDLLRTEALAARGRRKRNTLRALQLTRAEVDSPRETRLRLLFVLAGLLEPEVNHVICDGQGAVIARLDMAYVNYGVAVEYDGRHHAESPAQWQRDLRRREMLDRLGWTLLVVTAEDLTYRPDEVLDRVQSALRRAGMRVCRIDDRWAEHFPPLVDTPGLRAV